MGRTEGGTLVEIRKPTVEELRNLETELRLRALNGMIPIPPSLDDIETPEERQKAWEHFTLIVYYQRQLGKGKI